MRHAISVIAFAAMALFAAPALAQPLEDSDLPEGVPRGPAVRERLLRAFDKDNSGSLDEAERDAMRAQFRERFERRREGAEDRQRGDDRDRRRRRVEDSREGDRGRRDGRAAERPRGFDGPRGPRGPMGGPPLGPPLEPLFDWFDGDNDNSLSREEFRALSEFVRRHAERRRGGPPGGPRFGRDGENPRWQRDSDERRREGRGRGGDRGERSERREREPRPDRPGNPPPRPADPPTPPNTPQPANPSSDEAI